MNGVPSWGKLSRCIGYHLEGQLAVLGDVIFHIHKNSFGHVFKI